jgi:hypothetical protein
MNLSTDRDRLLSELFSESPDAEFRAASLELALKHGAQARERRRFVHQIALVLVLLGFGTVAAKRHAFTLKSARKSPEPVAIHVALPTPAPPSPHVKIITDDELLDYFSGHAVALVGPPEHRRLLLLDAVR